MFEKLLANLPYNPGLAKQIGFYARRMRHEESLRRTGMVFVVLAFMVQFFAFISPPQSTTAYSSSDLINGGIASKADAVAACRQNIKNYADVMWNFKITCDDIASSGVTSVRSTDYDNRLFSLSWLPYGQTNPHSGKQTDETPYNLAKVAETIYARRLTSADTIPFSTYQVLKGTSSDGRTFFIMFGCGNLMLVGVPNPVETCRYQGNIYYAGSKECNPPPVHAEELCPYDINIPRNDARCKPCKFDRTIPRDSNKCKACPYDDSIPIDDKKCPTPCPYNNNIPKDSPKCKPCKDASSSENTLACIVEHKAASNVTQNVVDANGTTAQLNDVIVYTLFAENKGKADVKNFVMQENLSDVLDYATVVDLHGGKMADNGLVTWPSATIKPGTTLTHKITVRVKNPLPVNTPPAGDPNHFDHVMTNVYGNTVNINVPLPPGVSPVVTVSTTTSEALPKTGPGESLVLAVALIIVVGYFFARSRLLVNESMIVMQEKNAGKL
ncbi:hypothetical protein BH09PAT3_BH09PAT3_3120 [soil metagenome]